MREFFKGWRRKLGCALLLMATAAASGWCRSLSVQDRFKHVSVKNNPVGDMRIRQLTSESGILCWEAFEHFEDFLASAVPQSGWTSRPIDPEDDGSWANFCQQRYRWAGFEFAHGSLGRARIWTWSVPYWSLAVPPTVAAGWLILWKSRAKGKSAPKRT